MTTLEQAVEIVGRFRKTGLAYQGAQRDLVSLMEFVEQVHMDVTALQEAEVAIQRAGDLLKKSMVASKGTDV